MAERIADPVNRLTRATRRIARGDLDARIAATSSDELRRPGRGLQPDGGRSQAPAHRARADAAARGLGRHGAAGRARHQESADADSAVGRARAAGQHRSRPAAVAGPRRVRDLDPAQVKLLRQISAEFSSFASSPTPRPEPTALPALIEEVVEPYRTGLAGRIAIDVDCAPDLPPVTIDRTLFARALTNVIENALHAMPGNGEGDDRPRRSPARRTAARRRDRITDTGVGMDQDVAREDLRAVLLDQGHRHRAGPDDREAQRGAERRDDRRDERARRRHDGDDCVTPIRAVKDVRRPGPPQPVRASLLAAGAASDDARNPRSPSR